MLKLIKMTDLSTKSEIVICIIIVIVDLFDFGISFYLSIKIYI